GVRGVAGGGAAQKTHDRGWGRGRGGGRGPGQVALRDALTYPRQRDSQHKHGQHCLPRHQPMLSVFVSARGASWLMDAATARRSRSIRCPQTALVIVMLACPKISETTCSGVPWASRPRGPLNATTISLAAAACELPPHSAHFVDLRCFAMQQRAATSRRLQGGGGPAPSPHQSH